METQNTYDACIGLDAHKETIAVALASPERAGEIRFWGNINNVPASIRRFFTKAGKNYSTMLVCYEAGTRCTVNSRLWAVGLWRIIRRCQIFKAG